MSNKTTEEKIDALLMALANPVSEDEAGDGWTIESKMAMRTFFEELKRKLQSGEPLLPLNISRALDHWGVVSGELLDMAAQVSNELRSRRHK